MIPRRTEHTVMFALQPAVVACAIAADMEPMP